MIRTLIIEDEKLIAQQFETLLQKTSADTEIVGSFSTVRETVAYLSSYAAPDLIFSDVRLADGLSFDIFNQVSIKSPVVFVTGYDQFMMNAFEHNGIDYLLKPVDEKDLCKTLAKYRSLENHFSYHAFVRSFRQPARSRMLVKKGMESILLKLEEIVIIYTENKLVYVIDKDGRKYIIDKNLSDLEEELDRAVFFRVNRQYIVNIAFIKSFKAYEKVKLQVDLSMPELNHRIIVSQETAPCFRKWISEL